MINANFKRKKDNDLELLEPTPLREFENTFEKQFESPKKTSKQLFIVIKWNKLRNITRERLDFEVHREKMVNRSIDRD